MQVVFVQSKLTQLNLTIIPKHVYVYAIQMSQMSDQCIVKNLFFHDTNRTYQVIAIG
jgi:hypothetical protein